MNRMIKLMVETREKQRAYFFGVRFCNYNWQGRILFSSSEVFYEEEVGCRRSTGLEARDGAYFNARLAGPAVRKGRKGFRKGRREE